MLAKFIRCAVVGLNGALVDDEVDFTNSRRGLLWWVSPMRRFKNRLNAYAPRSKTPRLFTLSIHTSRSINRNWHISLTDPAEITT